ncbi:hypothetical protein LZ575_20225 [Antarcticibacterium sp. 1MA-6-2]|uniref:hypothetical protein n=1 Tax=Antarcticibacterium sp. 1MA-6-2 TaxID=2908210 RepID=UPI001F3E96EE|nr:hypothetical protein [Antarcticibacterium sp. 1MA-6-2]UJH90978.1 hypothetical protein LZ575_20225 [Antarcticibacterium sp. 1MA-6-2]
MRVVGVNANTGEAVDTFVDARSYYRNNIGRRVYEEWLFDASYVKLREVRLGYNFSEDQLATWPLETVNIALIARNPLMIWQEAPRGIDPSEISLSGQSISWYESGQLVSVRSYGININITF